MTTFFSFFNSPCSNLEYSHKCPPKKSSTFWNLEKSFCGARCNPPIDEVRKNIKFSVYPFIDDYGMDFVIDTIRSIKIEEGASAWDALVKEYYLGK